MPDFVAPKRLSARFIQIFILAGLVAASFAPVRLSAQEAAPVAAPAAKSEAAPSQEEQNKVFRLEGPLVKWMAKMLNTSPETAATIFEFINFGAIVLLLGIPLYKALPKVLRARGERWPTIWRRHARQPRRPMRG
jgi:hypothetical protein